MDARKKKIDIFGVLILSTLVALAFPLLLVMVTIIIFFPLFLIMPNTLNSLVNSVINLLMPWFNFYLIPTGPEGTPLLCWFLVPEAILIIIYSIVLKEERK